MYISVIIPSFQPGEYLLEAVQSIIEQLGDFKVLEILIIDDGSKDIATLKVYEILSKNRIVKLLKNEGLRGSAGARNTGLRSAQGEWIVFLDADDLLLPYSLERRVLFLKKNPDIFWCGGDFVQFTESSKIYSSSYFETRISSYPFLSPAFNATDKTMILKNPILNFLQMTPATTGVIIVSRSALLESNGFDESLKMQQDVHLFLRLALRHDYGFIAAPLMANRQHSGSTTRSQIDTHFWRIKAFKKLVGLPEFFPYRNILRTQISKLYIGNSYALRTNFEYKRAIACAANALKHAPLSKDSWKSLAGILRQLVLDTH